MGHFNRGKDNRSGGGRDRGGFGGGRGRDRGGFGGGRDRDSRPTMHQAVCDGCKSDCEVPFRPTSGKPIYCSNCFKKDDNRPRRDDRPRHDDRRPERSQDNTQLTESINNLNKKLDQILNILQTPKVEEKAKKSSVKKVKDDTEYKERVAKIEIETKPKVAKKKKTTKTKTKAKVTKPKVTKAKKLAKKKVVKKK